MKRPSPAAQQGGPGAADVVRRTRYALASPLLSVLELGSATIATKRCACRRTPSRQPGLERTPRKQVAARSKRSAAPICLSWLQKATPRLLRQTLRQQNCCPWSASPRRMPGSDDRPESRLDPANSAGQEQAEWACLRRDGEALLCNAMLERRGTGCGAAALQPGARKDRWTESPSMGS